MQCPDANVATMCCDVFFDRPAAARVSALPIASRDLIDLGSLKNAALPASAGVRIVRQREMSCDKTAVRTDDVTYGFAAAPGFEV